MIITAPRDTLDVLATLETLVTSRGQLNVGRDEAGRIVELRTPSGWTYKYVHGAFGTYVTEIAPNGCVTTDIVPNTRQVSDLTHLFG